MNTRTPLALLLLLSSGACAAPGAPEADGRTETERLNAFFEEVFRDELARDPDRARRLGFGGPNDRWTDFADVTARRDHDIRRANLARLAEFDPERLDATARLSHRLFRYENERAMEAFHWRHHRYPVNQMFGHHTSIPSFLMDVHRVEDVGDAEDYVARLADVQRVLADVAQGLVAREERGVLPPAFVFPMVIRDCRNLLTGAPFAVGDEGDGGEDSTLLADFRAKVAALDVDAPTRARLVEAAEAALRDSFRPAYEGLIAVLERQATLASADDGVWKLPGGADFYAYCLRSNTTTNLGPDEIHRLGLAQVARIHAEMRAVQAEVGFEGDLQAFFAHLREDPRFCYPDDEAGRAAYLARAGEIVDAMRARLDELFLTQPRAPMIVKAVEPYREASAGKAFYSPGTPDGSRPGIYYANLFRMGDMPKYQMEALAYHEGIPGHHMQNSIARELEGVPAFRRFGRYTAYGEGWGLYSERVPKEMGFYADPYSDFGRLAMELWRACRLVVDSGLHNHRWTREEAIAYLRENTPNPEGDCRKAIERYIVMPGQATAYQIGLLEILRLRERARERLGPAFDLRAFHDVVLTSGPVPLEVLEELVEAWVEGREG